MCRLRRTLAQLPGHLAGAADGKEIGNCRQHQKCRHGDRHRRCLVRRVEQANKIGIGQIIDQHDHLAENRRDDLPQHRLPDRQAVKPVAPGLRLIHVGSLLFLHAAQRRYALR